MGSWTGGWLNVQIIFTRGELQGQTALVTIANLFLCFHNTCTKVSLTCDNKTASTPPCSPNSYHLQHHHEVDINLCLQLYGPELLINRHWIKGHRDSQKWDSLEELKALNLSKDETYNVWCDKVVGHTRCWDTNSSDPRVLLNEKWAIYSIISCPHKITMDFNMVIYSTLR
jgi:hypothetical protein